MTDQLTDLIAAYPPELQARIRTAHAAVAAEVSEERADFLLTFELAMVDYRTAYTAYCRRRDAQGGSSSRDEIDALQAQRERVQGATDALYHETVVLGEEPLDATP